ncbi:MAG: hypothetical protein QM589_10890 [Thermomicrobiales bacterium]
MRSSLRPDRHTFRRAISLFIALTGVCALVFVQAHTYTRSVQAGPQTTPALTPVASSDESWQDTDMDGLSDSDEVMLGNDPLTPDADRLVRPASMQVNVLDCPTGLWPADTPSLPLSPYINLAPFDPATVDPQCRPMPDISIEIRWRPPSDVPAWQVAASGTTGTDGVLLDDFVMGNPTQTWEVVETVPTEHSLPLLHCETLDNPGDPGRSNDWFSASADPNAPGTASGPFGRLSYGWSFACTFYHFPEHTGDSGTEPTDTTSSELPAPASAPTATTATAPDAVEAPSSTLLDDFDGDGLSDREENEVYGTDPEVFDTDGDGLGDSNEVRNLGTDPLNTDTDGDGLPDGQEVIYLGTDPLNADTDGDGGSDWVEVDKWGTDPLVPNPSPIQTSPDQMDTDGDGLTNAEETDIYGTNPHNPDSDGDGYSDYEEIINGTDPNSPLEVPV